MAKTTTLYPWETKGYRIVDRSKHSSNILFVRNLKKREKYAMKCVHLNKSEIEYKILTKFQELKSKYVIRLHDSFVSMDKRYFILDYTPKGDLYDHLKCLSKNSKITFEEKEKNARHLFRQLMHGVNELHQNNVLHRDLKPDNLLVFPEDRLVITDFGLSTLDQEEDDAGGTSYYIAPEYLLSIFWENGRLGERNIVSDIWSCGLILYCLLEYAHPYETKMNLDRALGTLNEAVTQNKLCKLFFTTYEFKMNSLDEWKEKVMEDRNKQEYQTFFPVNSHFSSEVQDLLRKMLQPDPMKRIKLIDILQHPFVKK